MENAATRFGQRLAHTEKKYRDLALKKLTVYLTKKSEWSALEWDKLWKALFYCMWMSDKRLIQEELSSSLAALVHKLPSVELALGFVHSFFRTMHREWHGIDGLRLDKFYSLVRKFVRESIALLRDNDWEHEDVEQFASILSSEVVSQRPNGLRMHLADLYLDETWNAAGASVDTDSFLLLLEPFFTLLSSEYDKTVFKRVRELVFLPMLSNYKFGVQPEKETTKKPKKPKTAADETDETDGDEEEEEEDKVFVDVDLARVQHRVFTIASADGTAERNRSGLYDLYRKFFAITKADSLKALDEEAAKPKASPKKSKKASKAEEPVVASKAPEPATSDASASEKKRKKNKKRKNRQSLESEGTTEAATDAVSEVESEPEPLKQEKNKKQKTIETLDEVMETPAASLLAVVETSEKKSKKAKKKLKTEAEPVKEENKVTTTEVLPVAVETREKKAKKAKKEKKLKLTTTEAEPAKLKEAAKTAVEPVKAKKSKGPKDVVVAAKTEDPAKTKAAKPEEAAVEKPKKLMVVKSGIKFQRCSVCKGFGKGLVPAGKDSCGHCERSQKTQKKAAVAAAKKRKASEITASSAAAEAEAANAKKVTFGKNKALPHELSVKRLKASAKKDAVPKEDASAKPKSVLKASPVPKSVKKDSSSSSSKKPARGKGRMRAADFF